MVEGLARNYGETPIWRGLASNGVVVEVFASESGTWTIQVTQPDGWSCQKADGAFWENLSPEPTLDPTALRISAQLELRPSCAYYPFGTFARHMLASHPEAQLRVIRGGLAAAFMREFVKVPDGMRHDKYVLPGWRETVNFMALYSSPRARTILLVLVSDPCVVMATALDTGHVEKMLEQARERAHEEET